MTFFSAASTLVSGDTNGKTDCFLRDRANGQTTRISVASDGTEANNFCQLPSISGDGQFAALESLASNLVPGDLNGNWDVFVRELATGQVERVSVASDGTDANGGSGVPSLSADGRYVVFDSGASNLVPGDSNFRTDLFVRDRAAGATDRITVSALGTDSNHNSYRPAISADGRFVAFYSYASNLVTGDTNGLPDIFVRDRTLLQTIRVSVRPDGAQANHYSEGKVDLSSDGHFVTFVSAASDLVPGDTNGQDDVFVRDLLTGQTERVSIASDGTQALFGVSYEPAISDDGRYIMFNSFATNLVAGDTNGKADTFIHDRTTAITERVNVATDGTQSTGSLESYQNLHTAMSADGRYLAFNTAANNLVPGDTNNVRDVFVRDRGPEFVNSVVADAGPDQAVNEGVNVALDGSGSSDPEDDAVTYYWTQTGGTAVALSDRTSSTPAFRSPFVATSEILTFELAVRDALGNTASDFVDISVIQYNDPPVADAGPNGTVKEGAARMLDGLASYDPNGEPIDDYQWGQVSGPAVTLDNDTTANPTFVAPAGTLGLSVTFALVVSDGKEPSDADTVTIAIVENSPPVADAGLDQTKDEGNAVTLDGTASGDPDIGDTKSYAWQQTGGPAVTLANGTTAAPSFAAPAVSGPAALTFELTVTDDDPITPKWDTDSVVINVRDINAPPSCTLAVASVPKLWPPDHKMEAVAINGVTDADADYNDVTIAIGGVTQDEPLNGTGDGDSSPDAMIVSGNPLESVMIRRERAGSNNGRVYVVNFTASDGFESCNGSVTVTVPHSRNGSNVVNDGQTVNSAP